MQRTPSRRQWLSGIAASVAAWFWPRKTNAAERPLAISKQRACEHVVTTYILDASNRIIAIRGPVTTYTYDASVPIVSIRGTYTYKMPPRNDNG